MLPPEKLSAITPDMLARIPKSDRHRDQIRRERVIARSKLGCAALCALTVLSTPVEVFQLDQQLAAFATWGISGSEVRDVGAHEYRNDGTGTLTITLPGLGVRDSGPKIAAPLRPAFVDNLPNSKLVALEEGAVLHMQSTILTIRETIQENNPGHLILYGMSTGGKEMLEVMAALRSDFPDLKVTLIADSSPFTGDTAYELRDNPDLITFGEYTSKVQRYGGPIYNSLIDVYLSSDTRQKYLTANGFDSAAHQAEWGRIGRDVWNSDGTSTALRLAQLGIVASNDMEDQLRAIADDDPSLPPITFIYIANSQDRTVDVEAAIAGYRAICTQLDIRFVVYRQQGLPHASENDYPSIYNQTITIALQEEEYFEYQRALWLQKLAHLGEPKRSTGSGMQPR